MCERLAAGDSQPLTQNLLFLLLPGRVPLGTDGPDGRVPLGTDGVGDGGRLFGGTGGGEPGRVPLGTDAAAAGCLYDVVAAGASAAGVAARASLGTNTSTAKVKERCSPGCSAPTPTTWRFTSSPFSFLTETSTEYSHAWPTSGCFTVPSRASAEKLGAGALAAPGSNFRCFLHAGQLLALWRMTARQCGQRRVAPAGARSVLTKACRSPA